MGVPLRRIAAATLLATAAITAGPTSHITAEAAVVTQPTFTSPTDGAIVSGMVDISLTSQSPYLRLRMEHGPDRRGVLVFETHDGQAATSLDSLGLVGPETMWAADCADRQGTDCGPEVSVTVDVKNEDPTWSDTVPDRVTAGQLVLAQGSDPGYHHVRAWAIDRDNGPIDMGTWPAATSPYRLFTPEAGAGLSDGMRTIAVGWCQEWLNRCEASTHGMTRVEYQQQLDPKITAMTRHRITPNRDGRADSTTIFYTLDTHQTVRFTLVNSAGEAVAGPFSRGEQSRGDHQWTFGNRKASGIRRGEYTLRMRTSTLIATDWRLSAEVQRRLAIER
jgi:hypothetical protein